MNLEDGLPEPQRLLAFLAVASALTMAVLDTSLVNVALPVVA
jgi:DHA2 family multidrug resistance protein-like MFS transporter